MTVRIRRNIYNLDPNGPEIASLRKGVQAMKDRDLKDPNNPDPLVDPNFLPTDPTSWLYQASIHGTYAQPAQDGWNMCQHQGYFFVLWHRMYIYWFERILRAASGDPDLTLPYWNYNHPNPPGTPPGSDLPQAALPLVFRQPTDALNNQNPLYVPNPYRDMLINEGSPLPPWVVDDSQALGLTSFINDPMGIGFGGTASGPVHFSDLSDSGELEEQPHNNVHAHVGGNYTDENGNPQVGWMDDPNMAARDPIFWLHHSNIDRLWKKWSDISGNLNPTDDVWMTSPFTFYDENGNAQKMSARDVLDTVNQLGYDYEGD